jgi:hypothetical protein
MIMGKPDAACFAPGMSIEATRTITSRNPTFNTRNTMKGMPGHIKTGQSASEGGKGGKGAGPKREGPIGKRGSSGPFPSISKGTVTRSYKADSTGHPGRMERLKGHAKTSYEK